VDQNDKNGILAQCNEVRKTCAKNVNVHFSLQDNDRSFEHIYAEIGEPTQPRQPQQPDNAEHRPVEPFRSPPFDFDEMVNNMSPCEYICWVCCAFCNPDPNYI